MGKSYGVVKWAETTGKPLTIFTSRHELYGQYEQWCEERELSHLSLPAFHRECPTMGGENSIEGDVRRLYEAGIFGKELHENSTAYFGQRLPCQLNSPCPYMEKRDFDPSKYEVLIGHYLQAHNSDYLEERYVAFDEFPGDAYFFEPTHNKATRAITKYLDTEPDLPFDNWKQLFHYRLAPEYQDEIEAWTEEMGGYSHRDSRRHLQRSPDYHAHAPLLTHAALEFEFLDNEWEYADLGLGRVAAKSPEDEWTILIPPLLFDAESVVALDGTPNVTKWRLALGGRWIRHERVLDSDREKRAYLRDVLGLTIIQTTAGSKPYLSGRSTNSRSDGALLEGIRQREGERPAVITSNAALEQYRTDDVDNLIEESEHFGNLKGSNQFEETHLGAVIGSPHPPEDEAVQRWGAFEGESIERETDDDGYEKRGDFLDFGPLGNSLFRNVVHDEVLQAVMRFGRTPSESKDGATVYVHTSRLPHWVAPDGRIRVATWSEGMKEVVGVIRASEKWPDGEWTNREIADVTSVGTKQVGELLKELDEEGYVSHWRGGRGNAYHWENERLEEFTAFGRVETAE